MLTQEQISEAVNDVLPSVLCALKEEIKETAIRQAQSTLQEQIRLAVTEWIAANMVPEIHKSLTESKDGLVALVPKMAETITDLLVESLREELTQKLSRSWDRKRVFEALFT